MHITKILVIQNVLYEFFGVMYISTALKKQGHEISVLVENYDKNIIERAAKSDAEVIAFSCTSGLHKWVLEVSRKIKKLSPNKLILVGGPHPTYFPEIINEPEVDIICLGEGEGAVVELANKLRNKEDITGIKDLWVKKDGKIYKNETRFLVENLDDLGFPDREVYYKKYKHLRKNPRKPFYTGRGCPYACTFCFNHSFKKLYKGKGRQVRRRSPEHVIAEIKDVRKKYPLKTVYLQDDTFILNKAWVKDFLQIYKKEINLPFICMFRANLLDESIMKDLKDAGCAKVFFGVESGNEEIRNNVLKKGVSNEDIIRAGNLLNKYKIKFKTYNIFGLPGETLEHAFETVEINRKIKTAYPFCTLLQPYPRTEIFDQLVALNALPENYTVDDLTPSYFLTTPTTKDTRMINLQKLFYYAVKFPFLDPLIRRLIKLKPNMFFDFAYWVGYAHIHSGSENLSFISTVLFGLRNLKSLIPKQKPKK